MRTTRTPYKKYAMRIAKNLKELGIGLNEIVKSTGLTVEEVEAL